MGKLKARIDKGVKNINFDREDGLRYLVETLYSDYDTFNELIESLPKELNLTNDEIKWCKFVYGMCDMHKNLGID